MIHLNPKNKFCGREASIIGGEEYGCLVSDRRRVGTASIVWKRFTDIDLLGPHRDFYDGRSYRLISFGPASSASLQLLYLGIESGFPRDCFVFLLVRAARSSRSYGSIDPRDLAPMIYGNRGTRIEPPMRRYYVAVRWIYLNRPGIVERVVYPELINIIDAVLNFPIRERE